MTTIISFLLAILILVTVHEFGHFWVARKLGVKVLRFSVGFGKVLLARKSKVDGTEFVISAIPLGGYVKMLDEREAEVPEAEKHLAFNRKSLGVRTAVVFAGPLFNFLFAVLAYWLIAVIGTDDIKPVVGKVAEPSIAAQAGVAAGDNILKVGSRDVLSWKQALEELIKAAMDSDRVELELQKMDDRTYSAFLDSKDFAQDPKSWLENLGLEPKTPEILAVVDTIVPGSPAARAGLLHADKILSINGNLLNNWQDLVAIIKKNPETELEFKVQRPNRVVQKIFVIPETVSTKDGKIGRIGITPLIPATSQEYLVLVKYGPLEGFERGLTQTVNISWLTVKMIWKMLTGESSFSQNIGGPVSIAQFAGNSFHAGFASFVSFLALISISLGVLNLLPIPVLDGGHLLFYLVEFIKGSPVSENFEILFQKIGIALIALLTFFAIYNDINRLALN